MLSLIETNYKRETFCTRQIEADAVGTNDNQFVLLGEPTLEEIIAYANDNLAAPDSGDFDNWTMEGVK